MNKAVQDMLSRYKCQSAADYENALREIFQELALLGLWRGKFFEHAAFYGGTALRILHGMDRFSEDMDFSLLKPNSAFDFSPYCSFIEKELEAWGFQVKVELKRKSGLSAIESAFLKADTLRQMLAIEVPAGLTGALPRGRTLKIKVEVDTDPPPAFATESKYLLQPIPFAVRSYALPSMLAGKIHALLFRKWGRRVKGRDWYDWVWYAAHDVPVDMAHLTARMRQTGHWKKNSVVPENELKRILHARIENLDVQAARFDVEPFLHRPDSVAVWSADFFASLAARLKIA